TFPALSVTSRYKYECGLIHSTLVTTPVTPIGFERSNSACTEWCANAGTLARINTREMACFIAFPLNLKSRKQLLGVLPLDGAHHVRRNSQAGQFVHRRFNRLEREIGAEQNVIRQREFHHRGHGILIAGMR